MTDQAADTELLVGYCAILIQNDNVNKKMQKKIVFVNFFNLQQFNCVGVGAWIVIRSETRNRCRTASPGVKQASSSDLNLIANHLSHSPLVFALD